MNELKMILDRESRGRTEAVRAQRKLEQDNEKLEQDNENLELLLYCFFKDADETQETFTQYQQQIRDLQQVN